MKVTIIDYGMCNLRSVQKKLLRIGAEVEITSDPLQIYEAEKLILPGVGHFANGVKNLKESGLWDAINEKVLTRKTPILGICLGMQLMAKHSEEGDVEGFGWFDADVVKFQVKDKLRYKIPHMGWNSTVLHKNSELMAGLSEEAMYYFVHAYHIVCKNKADVLCSSEYEYSFTSAVERDAIFGLQFHPEKSHDWGEQIFQNFIKI